MLHSNTHPQISDSGKLFATVKHSKSPSHKNLSASVSWTVSLNSTFFPLLSNGQAYNKSFSIFYSKFVYEIDSAPGSNVLHFTVVTYDCNKLSLQGCLHNEAYSITAVYYDHKLCIRLAARAWIGIHKTSYKHI